jgi:hypothetical protein
MELKNELRGRISMLRNIQTLNISLETSMEVKCDRITLCNSKRIERRGTLVANGCICVY